MKRMRMREPVLTGAMNFSFSNPWLILMLPPSIGGNGSKIMADNSDRVRKP